MKIGSLFDGSGGFPLAASMCGIEPVWAAEVEPYPIAVTRSRFPNMTHLGDISKINGAEIEPVEIISFGAPCQDLSVAGLRKGLRHEGLGDGETTRSGLFMEAVRIIKEMREATNGEYPRYAIYENVPGAFSSSKGQDWRIVLEELIKIVEPTAVMPEVPKNGWPYADVYCGDGWSISYRTLDAQHFGKTIRDGDSGAVLVRGTPQRRRRIYLVADFRGQRAGKISFEREGLRGHFETGRTPWEAVAGDAESGVGAADREGNGGVTAYSFDSLASNSMKSSNPHSGCRQVEIAKCLDTTDPNPSKNQGGIAIVEPVPYTLKIRTGVAVDSAGKAAGKGALIQTNKAATLAVAQDQYLFQPVPNILLDDQGGQQINVRTDDKCPTLRAEAHGNVPAVVCSSGDVAGTLDASYYKGCGMRQGIEREYVVEQHLFENHSQDSRYRGPLDVCPMHPAQLGTGGNNQPFVVRTEALSIGNGQLNQISMSEVCNTLDCMHDKQAILIEESPIALDRAFYNQGVNAQFEPQFYTDGTVPTLVAKGPGAVAVSYIVRRLTPTECARLQGFPDKWGHPDKKEDFTDEEYRFWLEVRNTHATVIGGKEAKDYTKEQMLTWYNKLHTDSSEYKMWGNGIALPCALYVMEGIADEPRN